jgi:hypothetical protein
MPCAGRSEKPGAAKLRNPHRRSSVPQERATTQRPSALRAERASELGPRSRSDRTVGVAQWLLAEVVAGFVVTIASTEVCVFRAVGAVPWPAGRQGRLSGRRGGDLVLVELQ